MSPFEELLVDLGKNLNLSLHLDRHHACSIRIHTHLIVQIQLDLSDENVWIFSKLIEIPPGKFRENVLKEALKANAFPDPRNGIFGYISATNQLALFLNFPLHILNGQRLAGLLGAFVEMALKWQKAIESGQKSPLEEKPSLPNPFGIK